jgi:cytochrome c553
LQKAVRAETPAAGDKAAGKAAVAACAGCHGELGVSAVPATPSLAGQDAQYLAAALGAYKSAGRSDETMKGIAATLDDAAMKNVAAYYSSLQPQSPNVRKPLATAEWAERCDRCHGTNGNSTDPRLPALAGQREDYLQPVLQAYRAGKRKSSAMSAMSAGLSDADIDNLAAYYSHQKARAVVYVTLPAK